VSAGFSGGRFQNAIEAPMGRASAGEALADHVAGPRLLRGSDDASIHMRGVFDFF
jgi:hypothetical protein